MRNALIFIQIIISILLIAAISIQARGTGLGSAWGGTGQSYHSKKGMERVLFAISIVLGVLFVLTSVANLLV